MNQVAQPVNTGRWIGRFIVAVLVAEGVWGLIVSLTRDLIMPYLAQQMGGASQPAQNAGNINVPGIFAAVIALCLAGLVAVILNFWVNRAPRPARVKAAAPRTNAAGIGSASLSIAPPVRQAPAGTTTPPPASATPAPTVQQAPGAPVTPSRPTAQPAAPAVAPKPTPTPASAAVSAKPAPVAPPPPKPAKPKPPKEIQYNIVGEPISPMDEDE